MLADHCDQNNRYEVVISGYKTRKYSGFYQVRNLVNIPTSALTLGKVSHSFISLQLHFFTELRFLFQFSHLKTIVIS